MSTGFFMFALTKHHHIMNDSTLTLPCKPYVKRFLINQFGNPVNLRSDRYIYNYFKMLLVRKICRYNKKIDFKKYGGIVYNENVEIILDTDTFNRFGFDMTNTSMVDFNMFLEDYIKTQVRLVIISANSFGQKWIDAIKDCQNIFGFSEEEFSTESIQKDLQRNKDLIKIFEKNFGDVVHDFGDVVHKSA